jgi:hypothetical protein
MYYYSFYSCIIPCCHQLIFFWGGVAPFYFFVFLRIVDFVNLRWQADLMMCPSSFRTSIQCMSACVNRNNGKRRPIVHTRRWRRVTASAWTKAAPPKSKKKNVMQRESRRRSSKKKIKEKEATTVNPYIHDVRLGKSPQTNSHKRHRILWGIPSISPPSIHPSNRREGTRWAL